MYKIYVCETRCLGAESHGYYLPEIYTTKREAERALNKYRRALKLSCAWVSQDWNNL